MQPDQPQREAKDVLKDLHQLLAEEEETVPENLALVRARLREEQIDTSSLKQRIRDHIDTVRATDLLSAAKEKRLGLIAAFERCKTKAAQFTTPLKDEVLAKIQLLSQANPEAAQVFCRKFENAADDDLPGLYEDLQMLDELSETGEDDHDQNG